LQANDHFHETYNEVGGKKFQKKKRQQGWRFPGSLPGLKEIGQIRPAGSYFLGNRTMIVRRNRQNDVPPGRYPFGAVLARPDFRFDSSSPTGG
jgi:hypothetical protein